MNENAQEMMQRFERIVDPEQKDHLRGIDIRGLVGDCTLDTICETAMGVRVGAQSDTGNVDYISPLNTVLTLAMDRIMEPLLRPDMIYNITPPGRYNRENLRKIHSFIRKVIANRKTEMERTISENKLDVTKLGSEDLGMFTKKRYAFLDSLLVAHFQNPTVFTMKDIEDEVNTFMFEGESCICVQFLLVRCAGFPNLPL